MKIFKFSIMAVLLVTAIAFTACGGSAEPQEGKEYTSAYICPMHCDGSGSEEAGICPVCKMDYVANPDKVKAESEAGHDDHDHDHDDHGHDH